MWYQTPENILFQNILEDYKIFLNIPQHSRILKYMRLFRGIQKLADYSIKFQNKILEDYKRVQNILEHFKIIDSFEGSVTSSVHCKLSLIFQKRPENFIMPPII